MLYRSLIREQTAESREKIDHELTNPGHEMRKIESHPAVKKDPALGVRLHYQGLIKSAKTETRKNELAHELGRKLAELAASPDGS